MCLVVLMLDSWILVSVYIVALVLVVIKIFIKIILISHINITSTLPRPSSSSSFLNLHPLHLFILFILFMSPISSIPCLAPIICQDNIFIKINKTIGINIACTLPPSNVFSEYISVCISTVFLFVLMSEVRISVSV